MGGFWGFFKSKSAKPPEANNKNNSTSTLGLSSSASTLCGEAVGGKDDDCLFPPPLVVDDKWKVSPPPPRPSPPPRGRKKGLWSEPLVGSIGPSYSKKNAGMMAKEEVHYIIPEIEHSKNQGQVRLWCAVRTVYVKEWLENAEVNAKGFRELYVQPIYSNVCVREDNYWVRTITAQNIKGIVFWKVVIYFRNMHALLERPAKNNLSGGQVCIVTSPPLDLCPVYIPGKKGGEKAEIVCRGNTEACGAVWLQQTFENNDQHYWRRITRNQSPTDDDGNNNNNNKASSHLGGKDFLLARIPYITELPPFAIEKLLDGVDQALVF